MPKYVLAYHGGRRAETPAEQAKVMDAWVAWFAGLGDAVVDGGNPTGAAKTVSSDGSITDGGGANALNGYSLLTATSTEPPALRIGQPLARPTAASRSVAVRRL